jgi:hypothetical protein
MRPVIKLVTPDVAEQILKSARINNYLKRTKIEKYKKMMLAGKWKDRIGTPIVIKDNKLIDGRHRLIAILETGLSYNIPFEYVSLI